MARNGAAPSSIPNRLLSHLQPEQLERLRPDLKLVPLRVKDILHARGDRLEHAYFPLSGMVSFVVRVDDGDAPPRSGPSGQVCRTEFFAAMI